MFKWDSLKKRLVDFIIYRISTHVGFMGTVIGMIQAFDKIEAAGDMQLHLLLGNKGRSINNSIWFDCCNNFTDFL